MTRPSKRALAALLVGCWSVLLMAAGTGAAQAAASPIPAAVAALQDSSLYIDPTAPAANLVDAAQVKAALAGSDIKVAVLPAFSGSSAEPPAQIGQALGGSGSVIALEGKKINAASNRVGNASELATQAFNDHTAGGFTKENVTGAVVELAGLIKAAEQAPGSSSGSSDFTSGGSTSTSTGSSSSGSSHGGVIVAVLAILVLAGAGGGTYYVMRNRRRSRQELADAKSDVDSLYQRLGGDILTLEPNDDDSVLQALADASERYNSGGSALVTANSLAQLKVARKTLIEGLHAARVARVKMGLDPGPEIPPISSVQTGQLTSAQTVKLGDKEFEGRPTYEPGNSHYYGGGNIGGNYVPGGWYSTPFWEPFLLGAVLSGGFGGFGGGYGGGGYDAGYNQGYDAGQDSGDNSGGGGGWGGGDWGGGGGGGDWGGGGGDWGGGGGGGGGDGGGGGW